MSHALLQPIAKCVDILVVIIMVVFYLVVFYSVVTKGYNRNFKTENSADQKKYVFQLNSRSMRTLESNLWALDRQYIINDLGVPTQQQSEDTSFVGAELGTDYRAPVLPP